MLLSLDTIGVFRVAPVPPRQPKSTGWAPAGRAAADFTSLYELKPSTASSRKMDATKKATPQLTLQHGASAASLLSPASGALASSGAELGQATPFVSVDVMRGGAVLKGNARAFDQGGPLAAGHCSWRLPNPVNEMFASAPAAAATVATAQSTSRGKSTPLATARTARSVSAVSQGTAPGPGSTTKAQLMTTRPKEGPATIEDVESLSGSVHELAQLYKRRLDAHMQHVV